MSDRQEIEELFASVATTGASLEQDMLWGYYFVDNDPHKLQGVIPTLKQSGFRFVNIFGGGEEGLGPFYLHVERVEQHSVDSLCTLNLHLTSLANHHGIESYDGMDVGHVDGRPLGPAPAEICPQL